MTLIKDMLPEDKIVNCAIEIERLHSMALGRSEDESNPHVVTFYGRDTEYFKSIEQGIKDKYFK